MTTARSDPAASSTATRSSVRWSIVGAAGNRIRQAGAGLVEQDHPTEPGEAFEHRRRQRVLPPQIEVRHRSAHQQHVARPVTQDLIGDAHPGVLRVPDLRRDHPATLSPRRGEPLLAASPSTATKTAALPMATQA